MFCCISRIDVSLVICAGCDLLANWRATTPTRSNLLRICYSARLATSPSSASTSPVWASTVLRFMPMTPKQAARRYSMLTSTSSSARNCRRRLYRSSQPCRPRLLERSRVLSSAACLTSVTSTRTSWRPVATCSCRLASRSRYVWRRSWTCCQRLRPRIAPSTFYSREAPTRHSRSCWRCHSLECIRSAVVNKLRSLFHAYYTTKFSATIRAGTS